MRRLAYALSNTLYRHSTAAATIGCKQKSYRNSCRIVNIGIHYDLRLIMLAASSKIVYMDNHATTRVDPRVIEAMLPYFDATYGNPHSVHAAGHEARDAVEAARQSIATAVGADTNEIVFTSGATESNNLAIRGVAERERRRGNHLVSVTTEHKAVLDPLARLARREYEVTLLDVEQRSSPRAGWLD